jgi:hypothetical protein
MKKWIIIIGAFLLLALLAARGLYKTINRVDDERFWYVGELNLKCTLQIDSIANYGGNTGGLYCSLISGRIDNDAEFRLNQRLLHHKRIRFLSQWNGQYYLLSRRAYKYSVGDSLTIDSRQDQIIFYREGKEIWKAKVTNSLQSRVF